MAPSKDVKFVPSAKLDASQITDRRRQDPPPNTGRANAFTRGKGLKLGLTRTMPRPPVQKQVRPPHDVNSRTGAPLVGLKKTTIPLGHGLDASKVRSLAANVARKKGMMRPASGLDPGKFMGEVGRNVSGAAGNFGRGVNEVNKAIGAAGDTAFGGLRRASLNIPDGAQSKKNRDALKKALGK